MTIARGPCLFCSMHDPSVTVAADAHCKAVVSLAPINGYHVLVIPHLHVERFTEIPADVLTSVMRMAQRVARSMALAAVPDGISYITEDDLTGVGMNLVPHWKLHVIARFKDDHVKLEWGRTEDPGQPRRAELARDLREHLPGS